MKRGALALLALLALGLVRVRPAAAADDAPKQDVAPKHDDAVMRGKVLPAHLVPARSAYWRVGLGLERFGTGFEGSDYLAALSIAYRYRAFAPNLLFLAKPRLSTEGYEESRFVLGLGLRAYVKLWGVDVSYGTSVQGELRFEDHFWLLHLTPVELSAVLFHRRTLDIELFVGARGAVTGKLIDSFLLDPNGFQNESAQATLDRATGGDRFHGFFRLVLSRRLD